MKQFKRIFAVLLAALLIIPAFAESARGAGKDTFWFPLLLPTILEGDKGSRDCALGSLTADSVRQAAGGELAIVNNGDIAGDLLQGELTRRDVEKVFGQDRAIAAARVTPAELKALLEPLVAQVTADPELGRIDREKSDFEGFPSVSGFAFTYDVSAPAGDRVTEIILEDGTKLDLLDNSTALTLGATERMLSGGYGGKELEYESLGVTLSESLAGYLEREGSDMEKLSWQRVTVIGAANENTIAGSINPVLLVAVVLLMIAVLYSMKRGRRGDKSSFAPFRAKGYSE